MADLRAAILAKLDEYAADHQPCEPHWDCLHRAVDALRAVVEAHELVPAPVRGRMWCRECGAGACRTVGLIGAALDIPADGSQP